MSANSDSRRSSDSLDIDTSDHALLGKEAESSLTRRPKRCSCSKTYHRLLLLGVVSLVVTNITSLLYLFRRRHCYSQSPIYPGLQGVDSTYRWTRFNATLFRHSEFVDPPSPKVDAAWLGLGVENAGILISTKFGKKADISPDHVVIELEPDKPNYLVAVEGLHQLHCLNLLRKSVYYNVEYYRDLGEKEWGNPEPILRKHVDHCLDMLRERLMCTADAGLLPYYWWQNTTVPDFQRDHHCRDFESLRAWTDRANSIPVGTNITRPPGAHVLEDFP